MEFVALMLGSLSVIIPIIKLKAQEELHYDPMPDISLSCALGLVLIIKC